MNIKKYSLKTMCAALACTTVLSSTLAAYATDVIINETPMDDSAEMNSINTLADDSAGTDTGDSGWTTEENSFEDIKVTYQQSSSYAVTIPKTIALDSKKQAAYSVKVSGEIDAKQRVYVAPVDKITDSENLDFYMSDLSGKKADVIATVTQSKTYWSSADVTNSYEETNNSVSAPDLTAGTWEGTFQVEIRLETEKEQEHTHNYVDGKCSCGAIDPNHTHNYGEDGTCTICGKEQDPYDIAPAEAYSNWNYTLDDENGIITLKHYIGSETDVIVYANYEVEGKTYKTQIATNYEHSNVANYMFNGSSNNKSILNIKSIKFSKNIDTSNVTDMNYMFNACYALTDLDISCFDTSNVTNMYNMFAFCESLTNLDVSNFDTSKVTTMSSMFYGCKSLTSLDLSNFDTSNVINMRHMFEYCSSLTTLDLTGFDTHNVTDMIEMFRDCAALKTIYVSRGKWSTLLAASSSVNYNYVTGDVAGTTLMFYNCGTSKVTYYGEDPNSYELAPDEDYLNWNYTLDDADNIITLNYYIGSETEVIVYANYVIGDKIYKTQIKSNDGYSSVPYMFNAYATGINHDNITQSIKFSHNIDTSNVTNMNYMFYNCQSLTDLDISGFDTSNVTDMQAMFSNCSNLNSLNFGSFDTSNVTDMSMMFANCKKLTSLNVSSFDTSNVTNMSTMFYGCKSLTSLDLGSFDTCKVTNMQGMFQNCSLLKNVYVTEGKWITEQVTNNSFMFNNCGTSSVTYK